MAEKNASNLDTVAGKYRIGRMIGSGAYGVIYRATNIISSEDVAVKLESVKVKHPRLKYEARVYESLAGGIGIPFVRWFGTESGCNIMVLDLLGPSLEDLFNRCGRKFSLKTVILLAHQLITRIEFIHSRSFIHRDIKPNNLLVRIEERVNQINAIDFGLAKKYRDPETHVHFPCREKSNIGAALFSSISTHLGVDQSRRDDMESIAYVLIYFCRGSLPWQNDVEKLTTSVKTLCDGLPNEFATFLKYTRSLHFEDKPDYSYIRKIFANLFVREGFQYDHVFDWTVYRYQKISQNADNLSGAEKNNKNHCTAMTSTTTAGQPVPQQAPAASNHGANQLFPRPSSHYSIESQPKTPAILQEQLWSQIQAGYSNLAVNEGYCIQVDSKLAQLAKEAPSEFPHELNGEQYKKLVSLHKELLLNHHNFFLACEHPSATEGIRRLPVTRNMPARLWKYAIYNFLKLLRARLPSSLDYMLQFIYHAYSIMTLFIEVAPALYYTWIECLANLGGYRMSIKVDGVGDKGVWARIARQWYLKCANRSPTAGRIYHHLAIVAPQEALLQLLYYGKSLAVSIPFATARESIKVFFRETLNPALGNRSFSAVITAIVHSHNIIFTATELDIFDETLGEITTHLDGYIMCTSSKYLEQGYYVAITNCIALFGYGAENNPLAVLMKPDPSNRDASMSGADPVALPTTFLAAVRLFNQTSKIHLLRIGDTNTLSFIHVILLLLRQVARYPPASALLFPSFPWRHLVCTLNALVALFEAGSALCGAARQLPNIATIESSNVPIADFPPVTPRRLETTSKIQALNTELDITSAHYTAGRVDCISKPLPEEFAMNGLPWLTDYYSHGWFFNEDIECESHYPEAQRLHERLQRVLWLGMQIKRLGAGEWLGYGDGKFFLGERGKACQG